MSRIRRMPSKWDKIALETLLARVRRKNPGFADDKTVFLAAHGSEENADERYQAYRQHGTEDPCARRFCVSYLGRAKVSMPQNQGAFDFSPKALMEKLSVLDKE